MIKILSKHSSRFLQASLIKAPFSKGGDATYIKANGRPLNIAHRGLASLFPQNTIPAFQAALYSGADFIELDVVYTKDNHLLVMHDPYLHRITNAQDNQFPHALEPRYYASDDKTYVSQWTDLLTLQELRGLRIQQKQGKYRIKSLDNYFGMPTLEEVIQRVILFNNLHQGERNPDKRLGGIMIEVKDGDMYRSRHPTKKSIALKTIEVLEKYKLHDWKEAQQRGCPIFLQSFDDQTVKEWHNLNVNLPRHQLVERSTIVKKQPNGLVEYARKASKYCHGLGVEDTLVYDVVNKQPYKDVVDSIKALNMGLHVWTFKDDDSPDKSAFLSKDAEQAYKIGQKQLQLDGIITQFSDTYRYISKKL